MQKNRFTPTGMPIEVWYIQIGDFRPISRYISQMVQDRQLLWNDNWNSYVLCRMVQFPVTLNDPNYPKPPNFRFYIAFHIFKVSGDPFVRQSHISHLWVVCSWKNSPFLLVGRSGLRSFHGTVIG